MMETAIGALMAFGAVKIILAMTRRRAAGRAAEMKRTGEVSIPCRISWTEGIGKRAFVYGKMTVSGGAVLFRRRSAQSVEIPAGGTISSEPSWRAGNTLISYRSPDGQEIRILTSSADTETVSRAIAAPG
ncbi:hypothetical protein [Streptomyces beijiangensis]|nr:hypothetical protein [Streptomyces beijiangensis]